LADIDVSDECVASTYRVKTCRLRLGYTGSLHGKPSLKPKGRIKMEHELGQWKQWTGTWQVLRKVVMRPKEGIKKMGPNLEQWEWWV
jgi:hypothetical protein